MKKLIKILSALASQLKSKALIIAGNAAEALRSALTYTVGFTEHFNAPRFRYDIECVGPDGVVKWRESILNLVTTAGKNDLLTQYFKGSAYTAAFFVGLIDNASFSALSAADTMASHAGWVEAVPYSNSTRPALTLGTAASGSIDNSASKASYTINATATINGAFTATNSTKSGTTGTLYSESSFGSTRSVLSGDTLNIQVTLSV